MRQMRAIPLVTSTQNSAMGGLKLPKLSVSRSDKSELIFVVKTAAECITFLFWGLDEVRISSETGALAPMAGLCIW